MRVGCCCVKFTLGGFVLLAPAASQPFKSGCVLLQVQKVSPSASSPNSVNGMAAENRSVLLCSLFHNR